MSGDGCIDGECVPSPRAKGGSGIEILAPKDTAKSIAVPAYPYDSVGDGRSAERSFRQVEVIVGIVAESSKVARRGAFKHR